MDTSIIMEKYSVRHLTTFNIAITYSPYGGMYFQPTNFTGNSSAALRGSRKTRCNWWLQLPSHKLVE